MVARSDQELTWDDVQLPYVVRYRPNALSLHFAVAGTFLAGAVLCLVLFKSFLAAGVPALLGAVSLYVTLITWRHVRTIDHLRIDEQALALTTKDGGTIRIPFEPELEFAVIYGHCCRSIVVSSAGDYWNQSQIVADMLDVPRGLTIYGLCDLMNDLSQGRARRGAGSSWQRSAVRRQQDWYREPARISRLLFLAGSLAVGALFLCVLFAATSVTWSWSDWISKPILFVIKFGLSLLFTYPAFRFLVVGRLRDLGEPATHGNAMGLIWNRKAGSFLRLFLRRGQEGRNQHGPEPRL